MFTPLEAQRYRIMQLNGVLGRFILPFSTSRLPILHVLEICVIIYSILSRPDKEASKNSNASPVLDVALW